MMKRIAAIAIAVYFCLATATAGAVDKKLPPGSSFQDGQSCPVMVVIPPGDFMMGSSARENGRYSDEGPLHRVKIKYKFAVGKYEVTQAEWRHVMGSNPSRFQHDQNPVDQVSWDDVQGFIKKLSQISGKRYRLLSEAEWEYVARARSTTRYFWGNHFDDARAAHKGRPEPVGRYGANRFGIHDMHGNVWEWVGDCWNHNYHGAPVDGATWTKGKCYMRVQRGGSWLIDPSDLRSAIRNWDTTAVRKGTLGFRIARHIAP